MSRSSYLVRAAWLAVLSLMSVSAIAREAGPRAKNEARRAVLSNVNPEVLLFNVYANLLMVRRCFDARQGNLAIFVNEAQLVRANDAARGESERIKAFAPDVRDDVVWRLANDQAGQTSQNKQNCSGALAYLKAY